MEKSCDTYRWSEARERRKPSSFIRTRTDVKPVPVRGRELRAITVGAGWAIERGLCLDR